MKIYVDDNDFKCHASNPDGIFREVEDEFFNGMCAEFIEGFCREEKGESVWHYPWKLYKKLEAAQREYERQLLKEIQENSILVSDLEAAYQEGVNSAYD